MSMKFLDYDEYDEILMPDEVFTSVGTYNVPDTQPYTTLALNDPSNPTRYVMTRPRLHAVTSYHKRHIPMTVSLEMQGSADHRQLTQHAKGKICIVS